MHVHIEVKFSCAVFVMELSLNCVLPAWHSFTTPWAAPSAQTRMATPEVAVAVFVFEAHEEYAKEEDPED